jgi:hypothetical protein
VLDRVRVCYLGTPVTAAARPSIRETTASAVATLGPRRRAVFVDVLRLVAAAQMVMGHTIDGLLLDELRQGVVFDRWRWVRGLTSVAFMVAAGMSYYLATLARFERHKSDSAHAWRRLRRGALLIGLGYAMHFPIGAFSGDASAAMTAWRELAAVDVLQCIGVAIVLLEGMTLLARRPQHVVVACAAGATFFVALAPLADATDPSGPFRAVLSYLTHAGGSLFPLFPWCGYVMAGVVAAYLIAPERPDGVAWRALVAALGAAALAMTVSAAPSAWTTETTAYGAKPHVATIKLAVVLALASVLALATQHVRRLPRVLTTLASETLAIYVSHLIVLTGAGVGLCIVLGHTLSLAAAISVGLVMIAFSAVAALLWNRVKEGWISEWRAGPRCVRTGGAGAAK